MYILKGRQICERCLSQDEKDKADRITSSIWGCCARCGSVVGGRKYEKKRILKLRRKNPQKYHAGFSTLEMYNLFEVKGKSGNCYGFDDTGFFLKRKEKCK